MKVNKEYLLELAEKREKIAIYTETQEQWNEILDVLRNSKFTCTIQNKQFESYREKSTINLSFLQANKIVFSSLEYHKKEGFKILSYSDVCINKENLELYTKILQIGEEQFELHLTKTAIEHLKLTGKCKIL